MLRVEENGEGEERHGVLDLGNAVRRWAVASLWGNRSSGRDPTDVMSSFSTPQRASTQNGLFYHARSPELDMYLDREPLLPRSESFMSAGAHRGGERRDEAGCCRYAGEGEAARRSPSCLVVSAMVVAMTCAIFLSMPSVIQFQMDSANITFYEINATIVTRGHQQHQKEQQQQQQQRKGGASRWIDANIPPPFLLAKPHPSHTVAEEQWQGGAGGWEHWRGRGLGGLGSTDDEKQRQGSGSGKGGVGGAFGELGISALVDVPVPSLIYAKIEEAGGSGEAGGGTLGLGISHGGCSIGSLSLSPLRVGPGLPSPAVLVTRLGVESLECFRGFATEMLSQETVAATITGSISLCIEVPIPLYSLELCFKSISVNRTMQLQGMGGFSGASISSLDLSQSTRDSLVATADVVLQNPSIIRIGPLGEFGINASMGDVQVGSFRSAGWVDEIGPGDNTISVMGGMNSEGGGSAMSELISSFLSGKDVVLDTVITDSSVPLVQSTMAGLHIPARLRQGKAMELLGDVTFKAMSLSQSSAGQGAVIAATLDIGVVSPLGQNSPVIVHSVGMHSAALQHKGRLVASFSVPPLPVTTTSPTVLSMSFSSELEIEAGPFADLVLEMVNSDAVNVTLSGLCDANLTSTALGDLSIAGLSIQRDITLAGFSGFKTARVVSFDVDDDEGESGDLGLKIQTQVTNPGIASARLGLVAFDVVYEGQSLGSVTADVDVKPGKNILNLKGKIRPSPGAAVDSFTDFITTYLKGQITFVTASGMDCAEPCAAWVQTLAAKLTITAPVPGITTDGMLAGLNVYSSSLSFSPSGQALLSGTFSAVWSLPWSIKLAISRIGMVMSLTYGGVGFASATVGIQDVDCDPDARRVNVSLASVPITVLDKQGFSSFVQQMVESERVGFGVCGLVDAEIRLPFGSVTPKGIPLSSNLSVAGMSGFSHPTPLITDVDVAAPPTSTSLTLSLNVSIYNPSPFSIDAGHITFSVSVWGCQDGSGPVAIATVSRAAFVTGWSNITAVAVIVGPPGRCALEFLSNYLNAAPSLLSLASTPDPNGVPLVQDALRDLDLQVHNDGLQSPLIHSANAYILDPVSVLSTRQIHASVVVTNPLSSPIEISSVDVNVTSLGTTLGYLKHAFAEPIVVAPNADAPTPTVCVKLSKLVSLKMLEAFIEAASSSTGAPTRFRGCASATVGGNFKLDLALDQGPIPAYVVLRIPPACAA